MIFGKTAPGADGDFAIAAAARDDDELPPLRGVGRKAPETPADSLMSGEVGVQTICCNGENYMEFSITCGVLYAL